MAFGRNLVQEISTDAITCFPVAIYDGIRDFYSYDYREKNRIESILELILISYCVGKGKKWARRRLCSSSPPNCIHLSMSDTKTEHKISPITLLHPLYKNIALYLTPWEELPIIEFLTIIVGRGRNGKPIVKKLNPLRSPEWYEELAPRV